MRIHADESVTTVTVKYLDPMGICLQFIVVIYFFEITLRRLHIVGANIKSHKTIQSYRICIGKYLLEHSTARLVYLL